MTLEAWDIRQAQTPMRSSHPFVRQLLGEVRLMGSLWKPYARGELNEVWRSNRLLASDATETLDFGCAGWQKLWAIRIKSFPANRSHLVVKPPDADGFCGPFAVNHSVRILPGKIFTFVAPDKGWGLEDGDLLSFINDGTTALGFRLHVLAGHD